MLGAKWNEVKRSGASQYNTYLKIFKSDRRAGEGRLEGHLE
jgi:hypothetical protein